MKRAPYYQDVDVTLYHGDAYEVIPELAAAGVAFDAVITDPPYGTTSLSWDTFDPRWVAEVAPLLAPGASIWCWGTLRTLADMIPPFKAAGFRLAQDLVWEKHNGSNFHADRFRMAHEQVAQFYRGAWRDVYKKVVTTPTATKQSNRRKGRPAHVGGIGDMTRYTSEDGGPRMMRSVMHVRSCHGTAKHPTQKPTGVLVPLITYSVPAGGLILDPFAGSASLLRAAKDSGRRAIGIEINEADCAGAVNTLRQLALPGMV